MDRRERWQGQAWSSHTVEGLLGCCVDLYGTDHC